MKRTESQENYLETILLLSKKKPVVRPVDIANELGFSKPSINIAESVISHNQAFDALSGLSDEDAGAVTILRI